MEVNGFERAGADAVTHADASIMAPGWPAEGNMGGGTGIEADVVVFVGNVPVLAVAPQAGNRIFAGSHLFLGDLGDFLTDGFFSGETEVWRDIGVFDDGVCVALAPCVSASSALCLREDLHDLFDLWVSFDGELVGGDGEPYTEEDSDTGQEGESGEGDLNEFVHGYVWVRDGVME